MSLPINLLITTLLIYVVGAFISLAVRRNEQLSINISGVTGVLAGVLGIVACIPVLISSDTDVDVFKTPFEFASFSIRIDGLAALPTVKEYAANFVYHPIEEVEDKWQFIIFM